MSGTSEREPSEPSNRAASELANGAANEVGNKAGHEVASGAASEPAPARKLPLKERLAALFSEYGRIAVITYFTLSILAIIGFSIAVGLGYKPTTSTGVIGVIFTGWALAKATLPIRILITLGLTPMVAHVVKRFRRSPAVADDASDDSTTPRA